MKMNELTTKPEATNRSADPDRPSARRRADIRFAIGHGSLGSVLVAVSEKGVCAILMSDDPEALRRELQVRFPLAHLVDDEAALADAIGKIVEFLEAPGAGLDLRLDVRGTEFQ